jgi:uncharacterized protein YabE (DUF348 family)
MSPARIRWLALGTAILVLLLGYLASYRTVTILADGEVYTLKTRAFTVGGALHAAGLNSGPDDELFPGRFRPLGYDVIIELHRAAEIQLWADGAVYRGKSTERDPAALLAEFDLDLNEGDSLWLAGTRYGAAGDLPYAPSLVLELRRAVRVALQEGGSSTVFESSAQTLGEALLEQGIDLYTADRLDPPPATPLERPVTATLLRAEPLEIETAGETITVRSAASTVGEALAEAGLALQGLDYSQPAEHRPIPEDRSIVVVRVTETVELGQETIPFQTQFQDDPEAEFGTSSVIQLGQLGIEATRTRVRLEDGEETARFDEGDWLLAEPKDQINGRGTQVVVRTTVIDGVEIEYWATLVVYVTSYSPCRSGVDGCLYGTSSGLPVQRGVVGTYLDWYRAYKGGTLYVPGYGPAVVGDVGAYPSGEPWIDLGYSDEDWVGWSSHVTIYFTTPVPATIPYFLYP